MGAAARDVLGRGRASACGEAGGFDAGDEAGEGLVDVGAEVPVACVVEGVDAAFGVDGDEGVAVGLGAEGLTSVSSARPRSASVRAMCRPWSGSMWRAVGATWRPGPVGAMCRPPNSAQASTAAGKTACRWPAGEMWSRRVSAQISACFMSQRPGCQPAARRAASTGTGKRVVEVRSGCICPSIVEFA